MNSSLTLNSYKFLGYFEVGLWVRFGCDCLLGFLDLTCKVAKLQRISFKNFIKFMFWWKVFVYQTEKTFSNVCFHDFTIGSKKPYDVLLMFFLFPFGFSHFALRRLVFLCIRNLQGFVRNIVQLRKNFLLMMITKIILLQLVVGFSLWLTVDDQNLRGYISFRYLVFYKVCICHNLD